MRDRINVYHSLFRNILLDEVNMCGRYTLSTPIELLQKRFLFKISPLSYVVNYNIAPSEPVLTITGNGVNTGQYMKWGLIPSWSKNSSMGSKMINARAETLGERPSFRGAIRTNRCLIIADSFYEWRNVRGKKIPFRIMLENNQPFAFAGLWARWNDFTGNSVLSCTIITTNPNSLIKPVHKRMPVILPAQAEKIWLDPQIQDTEMLSNILVPYPSNEMRVYEVSKLVNSPKNNFPELIKEIGYSSYYDQC